MTQKFKTTTPKKLRWPHPNNDDPKYEEDLTHNIMMTSPKKQQQKTSWGCAGVQLEAQFYFMFGLPKKFDPPKFLTAKNLDPQKSFNPRNFWPQNILNPPKCLPQKMLSQNEIWPQKINLTPSRHLPDTFRHLPDTFRHLPDTFQTPSRHPTNNLQTPSRLK